MTLEIRSAPDDKNHPPFIRMLLSAGPSTDIGRFALRLFLITASLALPALYTGSFGLDRKTLEQVGRDVVRLLTGESSTASRAQMPFMRDVASLYYIWMIPAVMVWSRRLLQAIEDLIPSMFESGSLRTTGSTFQLAVSRVNGRLGKQEVHLACLLAALFLTAIGSVGYARQGIYPYLSPEGSNSGDFALAAYSTWWARPFSIPSYMYLMWAWIGNYVFVWIGYVGVETVGLFVRMRTHLEFNLDAGNRDRGWGWAAVDAVMRPARLVALAAGFGVLAAALIANPASYSYLVFFAMLFGFSISTFLAPNHFYKTGLRSFVASMNAGGSDQDRRLNALILASVPDDIVKTRAFAYQLILVFLPAIIVFIQLLRGDS